MQAMARLEFKMRLSTLPGNDIATSTEQWTLDRKLRMQ
jgi:hypothetical protein